MRFLLLVFKIELFLMVNVLSITLIHGLLYVKTDSIFYIGSNEVNNGFRH